MSYRPLTAVLPRVILFAGILLAVSMLAIPLYNSAFAQDDGTIEYAENGEGPVATYTAVDPEGADIVWSVTGTDAGDFSIENGVLTFKSPPNFEAPTGGSGNNSASYSVTVEASDGGTMMDTEEVTVSVTNVDEPGTITLSSLQPQAGLVLTAVLTDPDGATSGTDLQWERASSLEGPWTPIEPAATVLTYTPENEDADFYLRLTAEYKDPESAEITKMAQEVSANPVRTGSSVGNSVPAFLDDSNEVVTTDIRTVPENTPAGQPVGDPVTATDEDAGDILTYTLTGNGADSFAIDVTNGQVMTKAALDADAGGIPSYTVTVTATDPFGANGEITVTITVEGINEAPTVSSGASSIEHPEGGTVLDTNLTNGNADPAQYTATDPDDGVTTTLSVSGADAGKFMIENGLLSFEAAPDYEMPGDANGDNVYEITVVATDNERATGMMSVTVKVTNVNEPGNVALSSVQPRVGVALTARLTDPDGSVSGVTWQWSRSTSMGGTYADIEDATSATYTPVAGDGDPSYYLKATASYTDGEDSGRSAEMTSVNQVLPDTTNKAPYFPDTDPDTEGMQDEGRERSVKENTEAGAADNGDVVGEPVSATDPNGDSLTYTLGGADAALFKVDQDDIDTENANESGQIRVGTGTKLDKETRDTYTASVTATDSYGLSATTMVTITVTNEDEAPELTGEAPEDYAENGEGPVATYTAVDPEGADIVWSVTGTDAGDFSIENGVLTFKSPPNFEAPTGGPGNNSASYSVTVEASDGGTMMDTEEVTVKVTNVDEPGTITLSSLRPQAGVVLTAVLTDPDGETSGTELQWERSSRRSGSWTAIKDETSMTYTPLNTDAGYYLRITAEYKDPESTENTKMARVVSANAAQAESDVGNTAPEFQDENDQPLTTDTRMVRENTPAGQPVGDPVTATEENAGDILTYTLEGNGADSFAIDVTNGQVMTKAALNKEDEESYSVTVRATDPFGLSDTVVVTITVEDINEAPTVSGAASIEHLEGGTVLDTDLTNDNADPADYAETDPDTGSTVAWSVSGADRGKFEIDTDGLLAFMANPNYEMPGDANSDNVYEIMVVATDNEGATGMTSVTVKVTNVNEPGSVALSSVQPRVVVALTATLTDPDGSLSGVTWQWSRSTTADGDYEDIEDATSATYTPVAGDAVDDEGNEARMYLKATASYTDGEDSGQSAEMTSVNQVLPDTTNKAPYFPDTDPDTEGMQDEGRERSVKENTEAGAADNGDVVGEPVSATDPNGDSLTYTLGGADAALFKVDQDDPTASPAKVGGQIRVGAGTKLDKETRDTYTVSVTATDSYGLNSTTMVAIMVNNEDEAPVIREGGLAISGPVSPSYPENDTAPVATYTASGPDAATAVWTLTGADADDFSFNNGMLTFNASPDYEAKADADMDNMYEVTLEADDGTYMDTHDVTVTVTNVAELGMVSGDATADYAENGMDAVETYTADGPVTAAWSVSGADMGDFDINAGMLTFKASPDFETPTDADTDNIYEVTVEATAGGEMDMMDVAVTVTNDEEMGEVTLWAGSDALTMAPQVGDTITGAVMDPDGGVTGETWQWSRTMDTANMSSWMDIEGETNAAYMVTADDTGYYLRVMATYTDASGTDMAMEYSMPTMMVTMMVTMNAAPMFDSETGTREVAENMAAGENVGAPVTAMDADNDTLTYSLGGTDAASFDIGPATGQLMTKVALDYETKDSYEVMVTATDPEGASDMITVTVTVTNVEEPGMVTLWAGSDALTMAPQVGDTITGAVMDPDGGVTGETWQWAKTMTPDMMASWMDIAGETNAAYMVTAGDTGYYLRVMATYTDAAGMAMEYSMPTMMVGAEAEDTLLSRYDANGNGSIDRVEMVDALRDYLVNETITREDIVTLLRLYLFG